jgi:hypothetical protein
MSGQECRNCADDNLPSSQLSDWPTAIATKPLRIRRVHSRPIHRNCIVEIPPAASAV